jgi:hypothetical protein
MNIMKRNIIQFIVFAAFTFILSSCLKDNIGEDWTSSLKGKMYATFQFAGTWTNTITPIAAPQTVSILVNIATDQPPTTAITVTVAVDQALLDSKNAADTSQHYQLYPSITIVNPQITIPAGTRVGYVTVNLTNADTLSLSTHWVLPVSITAATGGGVVIAANRKSIFFTLPIANIYEGMYHSVGFRHHPVLGDIAVDKDKYLSTINVNTVETYPADYTPYRMWITVNPDNTTSIMSPDATFHDYTSSALDPLGRGIVGGANTYDPVLKKFVVWVFYNAAAPRIIEEVYTKK